MLNLLLQRCTSKWHLWNGTGETDVNYITSTVQCERAHIIAS